MIKKIAPFLLLWVLVVIAPVQLIAQEGQPLFTIVYLKSGDVLSGQVTSSNDTILTLEEWRMGSVALPQKNVDRTQSVMSNAKVTFTLSGHARYSGHLISVREGMFILNTELAGEVAIPWREVREIELVKMKKGEWYAPNATRYFFAPSAIPVEKGSGYYQNAYLLSNSVNFGITQNFTLGGGIVIPILFYITPKVGFEVRKNLYLGAGLIAASTFIPDAAMSGGIPFGLMTCGTGETNFTIGVGYAMLWDEGGDFQHGRYPVITANGIVRLSNRLQLVSENWIIPTRHDKTENLDNGYYDPYGNWVEGTEVPKEVTELFMVLSAGLRVMISQRSTVDFAPVYFYSVENAPVIPYLDFVYKF